MKRNPLRFAILALTVAAFTGFASARSITVKPVESRYKISGAGGEFDHTHAALDGVLKTHVSGERVSYKALKASPDTLNGWLGSVAAITPSEFSKWSEEQQLALLINLYNAATLKLIIDNYPISSIKKIGGLFSGPWDQPVVKLLGNVITLDTLEHKILRTQYDEPRIHFAIVCAAKGCPPLRNEAFTAEKLEEQLEAQGKAFLGTTSKNYVSPDGKTLYLSPIFKWFDEDFEKKGSVSSFVKPYLPSSAAERLKGKPKLKYTDYDWSLNDL